jgi:aldehyde dehydrogenase (NAD+)
MPGWPGQLVIGGREAGEAMVDDPRVPLVSATGSTRMGREVGPRVAARFGRSILELGGNNAMILAPSADLDLAVRGILFSAVGTAGQRCTTLRRLIVHRSIKDEVVPVKAAYAKVRIGDPRKDNLVGPLIDKHVRRHAGALAKARDEGGRYSAASVSWPTSTRTPTTCRRPSPKCRRRATWCATKPSRRSSTCWPTTTSKRPCA